MNATKAKCKEGITPISWFVVVWIVNATRHPLHIEAAAIVTYVCTCICTALLSWVTLAHLVPLSVIKRRPVHFILKTVKEKSMECHNYKPQPFTDTKRNGKQTKPNKRKSNKRTKSTKINSFFPKRGNCNAERTEKRNNKITPGKT